jgi:hypothetical protein
MRHQHTEQQGTTVVAAVLLGALLLFTAFLFLTMTRVA